MDTTNSGLVQDEVLLEIVRVLEHQVPAGPSFLYALGTLIEAVVIHKHVYYDPLNRLHPSTESRSTGSVEDVLRESTFVRSLAEEGALTPLPSADALDTFLQNQGRDYRWWNFLEDAIGVGVGFGSADEKSHYENLLDLLKFPVLLQQKELVAPLGEGAVRFTTGTVLPALLKLGFNVRDLQIVGGLNRRAIAFLELAQNIGSSLYPTLLALPHQIGAIRLANSKAREIYNQVESQVLVLDEIHEGSVGKSAFERIGIPPLAQIVLERCRDSARDLANEICSLREEQRRFRDYLTDFERDWMGAKSRDQRLRLENDFGNAWTVLQERYKRSSTRIIYTLWDIVKSPTEILAAIGDKLVGQGRELAVIGKARGLHEFWQVLGSSPVPERNRELLERLFTRIADAAVWELGEKMARGTEELLKERDPTQADQSS